MDSQLTIRLPSSLSDDLAEACRVLRRTRSDLVRLALEEFLGGVLPGGPRGSRPVDRVRDLLGSYESGVPDLGSRHREHILRRLRGDAGE
jgi:hypothetical protein